MATNETTATWIALFLGLYILAAVYAELKRPGNWAGMIEEMSGSKSLRLLAGIIAFTMGAAIYLVTPWRPDDWLSVAVTILGALAVAKGVLLIAASDGTLKLFKRVLSGKTTMIAAFDGLIGVALILVALNRLEVF